jgi:hypothetical protein
MAVRRRENGLETRQRESRRHDETDRLGVGGDNRCISIIYRISSPYLRTN